MIGNPRAPGGMMTQHREPPPIGELLIDVGLRRRVLKSEGVPAQISESPPGAIVRMMELRAQRPQRIARVEFRRARPGQLLLGAQDGLDRPAGAGAGAGAGEGAGMTVPHTLQVRRSRLEKNLEKISGS